MFLERVFLISHNPLLFNFTGRGAIVKRGPGDGPGRAQDYRGYRLGDLEKVRQQQERVRVRRLQDALQPQGSDSGLGSARHDAAGDGGVRDRHQRPLRLLRGDQESQGSARPARGKWKRGTRWVWQTCKLANSIFARHRSDGRQAQASWNAALVDDILYDLKFLQSFLLHKDDFDWRWRMKRLW